jgi:hypothetical protein
MWEVFKVYGGQDPRRGSIHENHAGWHKLRLGITVPPKGQHATGNLLQQHMDAS